MSLKIIFIGDLNVFTESKSKCDAFERIGCDVLRLPSEPIPQLPGLGNTNSFIKRAIRKLRPMHDPMKINNRLLRMIAANELDDIDLIWSDKALNLRPKVLESIKQKYPKCKLIFASGDNMLVSAFRNQAFLESIHLFDAVLTMKSGTESGLTRLGAKKAFYVPKSYDETWKDLLTDRPKIFDVSFIGSFEIERARSMCELADSGVLVNVWGNGWGAWVKKNKNLIVHDKPLYHTDMIQKISETKINLCFLRKLARDKSTNRTFEIPACGGFMMAEDTTEQRQFFPHLVGAVYFSENADLIEKTQYFLKNDDERELISRRGMEICCTSGYGYQDRAVEFVENIWPQLSL